MASQAKYNCIAFDPVAREIILTAPLFNSTVDFKITQNPSDQNGGAILLGHSFNLLQPAIGVNIGNALNGSSTVLASLLSAWKSQVTADGALSANFIVNPTTEAFTVEPNYITP